MVSETVSFRNGNTVSSWEPNVIFFVSLEVYHMYRKSWLLVLYGLCIYHEPSFLSFKWKFELFFLERAVQGFEFSGQRCWDMSRMLKVLQQRLTSVPFKCFVNVMHFSCKMITVTKLLYFHLLVIFTQMKVIFIYIAKWALLQHPYRTSPCWTSNQRKMSMPVFCHPCNTCP